MKTKKIILMEVGKKIFDEFEDELWNADEIQVTFILNIEGIKDITAFKTSCEEIDLEDEDFDE